MSTQQHQPHRASYPLEQQQKGLGDVISLKPLYNPVGAIKDTVKEAGHNPLSALQKAGGAGDAILAGNVRDYTAATFGGPAYHYLSEADKAQATKAAAAKRTQPPPQPPGATFTPATAAALKQPPTLLSGKKADGTSLYPNVIR